MRISNRKWIGSRSELLLLTFFLLTVGSLPVSFLLDRLNLPSATDTAVRLALVACALLGLLAEIIRLAIPLVSRSMSKTPGGLLWLRIVAVVLWLGILPLVWFWVYDHIHRLRNHV